MQRGCIYKHHRKYWMLRYYDFELRGGAPVRVRKAHKLAAISPEFKNKTDVRPLADEWLKPINAKTVTPESTKTVLEFIEQDYFLAMARTLRPSTLKGYRDNFGKHLRSRLGKIRLRDFRTVTGQRTMSAIGRDNPELNHKTLLRLKSFLSGVFSHARREGIIDGENPMRGVKISGKPKRFRGEAYTITEIELIVGWLPEVARVVVSTAALTGLRLAELRGLRWGDFQRGEDGHVLNVTRTVWRKHVGETKNVESEAAIPVVPILARLLERFRERDEDGKSRLRGDHEYIFAGEKFGAPLNMQNLAQRIIQPALKKANEKMLELELTPNEPNKLLRWKGWHAFRRGLASNLYALGIAPKVIQAIMRHAGLATTLAFYTVVPENESRKALAELQDSMFLPTIA